MFIPKKSRHLLASPSLSKKKVSRSGWLVYLSLADIQDRRTGECFPSPETVATKAGVSRSTFYRAKKELLRLKLIAWDRTQSGCYYRFQDNEMLGTKIVGVKAANSRDFSRVKKSVKCQNGSLLIYNIEESNKNDYHIAASHSGFNNHFKIHSEKNKYPPELPPDFKKFIDIFKNAPFSAPLLNNPWNYVKLFEDAVKRTKKPPSYLLSCADNQLASYQRGFKTAKEQQKRTGKGFFPTPIKGAWRWLQEDGWKEKPYKSPEERIKEEVEETYRVRLKNALRAAFAALRRTYKYCQAKEILYQGDERALESDLNEVVRLTHGLYSKKMEVHPIVESLIKATEKLLMEREFQEGIPPSAKESLQNLKEMLALKCTQQPKDKLEN